MKVRFILIAGLLILCFIVPAIAERVDNIDMSYATDQDGNPRAVTVYFEKVVESDHSDTFSPVNFPPSEYKYITLYYSLFNPSDKDVNYEFNVSIKDQAGRYFYTDVFILGENVPANGQLRNRAKDFAVYRNSTDLQIVWTDKKVNPPWDHYDTFINISFPEATPTPTAMPSATPSPTPTPTPKASNPLGQCLPFLPLGLVLGGVGGLGWTLKRYRNGR